MANILDIVYPIARKTIPTMKRRLKYRPFLNNMERPDYEAMMDYCSLPHELDVRMAMNNLNILRNDARYSFKEGEIDKGELEERLQDYDDAERDVERGDFGFALDNYPYEDDPEYQTYMKSIERGQEHKDYLNEFREYRRLLPQVLLDPLMFTEHKNDLVRERAHSLINGEDFHLKREGF